MDWQADIDWLTSSGNIDKAAIFSGANDTLWASSEGFSGEEGVCVFKAIETIIVGHYSQGVQPGNAAVAVEHFIY
ncbi:hypothetical protein N7463_009897 [Penicillium fimorum]|uniref:Profilin n=1 Tax=Penicillium fimorum TaxID=1882269 RepID=A0A9X0C172_9EURO|nr:hypothetical protein N7463_009897 [Penicillium fimorum]